MNVTPLNRRTAQTLRERVAEEVRAELGRAGVSVNATAKALDWSQPYLQRRVSGTTAFDVDDLEKLAVWLDIPVERFLGSPTPAVSEAVSRSVSGRYRSANGAAILEFPQDRASRWRYLTNEAQAGTDGDQIASSHIGPLTVLSGHPVTNVTAAVGT